MELFKDASKIRSMEQIKQVIFAVVHSDSIRMQELCFHHFRLNYSFGEILPLHMNLQIKQVELLQKLAGKELKISVTHLAQIRKIGIQFAVVKLKTNFSGSPVPHIITTCNDPNKIPEFLRMLRDEKELSQMETIALPENLIISGIIVFEKNKSADIDHRQWVLDSFDSSNPPASKSVSFKKEGVRIRGILPTFSASLPLPKIKDIKDSRDSRDREEEERDGGDGEEGENGEEGSGERRGDDSGDGRDDGGNDGGNAGGGGSSGGKDDEYDWAKYEYFFRKHLLQHGRGDAVYHLNSKGRKIYLSPAQKKMIYKSLKAPN